MKKKNDRCALRRFFTAGPLALMLVAALQAQAQTEEEPTAAVSGTGPGLLSPNDLGLREDLAWLVDRRVLDLPLATWPMPTALLEPALAEARRRNWPGPDADALARVERALARQLLPASASLQVNSARHPALDGNASARGAADAALGLRTHGARWSARLQLNRHAHTLSRPAHGASLAGSYAAFALPGAVLSFGAVDRWWGPGRYTSPILSNAALPFPALTLRRTRDSAPEPGWLRWIGGWGYELSLGRLQHYEPARTNTLGMRLYARPFAGVELGVSRHIEWGGEGRPHGLSALGDALLGRSNVEEDDDREDPSNELAGFDLRLSHLDSAGRAWVGHAQLIGEDEAGGMPSRLIATAGLQLKHAWRGGRLEWSVEGTDTVRRRLLGLRSVPEKNAAYTHGTYVDGYYHQGLPIGAHIGGGASIYTAGVAWVPGCSSPCRRYHLTVFDGRVAEAGRQAINASFGLPGSVHGMALRMESAGADLAWHVGLSVQRYSAGPRPDAGVQLGIELPLQR